MGGQTHIFSPAFKEREFDEILSFCDHIVFNSLSQLSLFGGRAKMAGKSVGLRINPECSTQDHAIYDPCAPGSRLGVTASTLKVGLGQNPGLLTLIDGLHFHTLCEQNADALTKTLDAVIFRFGAYLPAVKWVNFGGGHHITRQDYDLPLLESCIKRVSKTYGVTVYLEPGEAVALNAGYLITTVLDLVSNGKTNAILDASAACHMPDVIEMPYRPPLKGASAPGEKKYTYTLGGNTCLAGDIIGEYSFDNPLKIGDRLVFEDMAIYSMVKNNTFNGTPLPAIALKRKGGTCEIIKTFSYADFKNRLS